MSIQSTGVIGLTISKMSVLMALSTGTVIATEIGDPVVMPWATLGVGGIMALTIFYFYRKQAEESAKREREVAAHALETAQAYKVQAALMIVTLQENSKVTAQLSGAVADLRTVVSQSSLEQRERYEAELRDAAAAAGRRSYDPPIGGHK